MIRAVRAFPVLPGKEEVLAAFMRAMKERGEEVDDFYRRYGVTMESWHIQTSPDGGVLVIVTSEAKDDAAFAAHAASDHPFDTWFKDRVKEISGINLNETPRGEPSREGFCWRDQC
ncbi:MAG: hypothetical protein KDN19_22945 [Verrucomicrobiae bacterium]|nr:hypothetical protein [Verrucomicrobiae bacterium]